MTKPECVTVVRIPGAMPEHVSVRAELGPFRGDSTRTEIQLSFEAGSPPEVEVSENHASTRVRLRIAGQWEREGLADAFIALGQELKRAS